MLRGLGLEVNDTELQTIDSQRVGLKYHDGVKIKDLRKDPGFRVIDPTKLEMATGVLTR